MQPETQNDHNQPALPTNLAHTLMSRCPHGHRRPGRTRSGKQYSWNHAGPVATFAMSSMLRLELALTIMIVPARPTAHTEASSPNRMHPFVRTGRREQHQ